MSDLAQISLDFIRQRLLAVYPEQFRACVRQLSDEQLWWRPNEGANSAGNLVLHVTGSLNHYLNHNLGGSDYVRDRPAEFRERGPVPREALLEGFESMIARAAVTFENIDSERLSSPSAEPERYQTMLEDLLAMVTHISTHAGQIVWITKMLQEGSLDEVWIRTHRAAEKAKPNF